MDRPVGIMIVGQDRILVEAVIAWLSLRKDVRVVGGAAGEERADVVLIDASLRRDEALAAAWRIAEEVPGAKAIVLGLDREDDGVLAFIEAGVLGYLVRGASAADLAVAVHEVHLGRTHCSPRIASSVIARIAELNRRREPPCPHPTEPLTQRESEILSAIAVGLSNKEIGKRLRISVSTVKNHVHNILEKMQVAHRRAAIKLAYQCGLLAHGRDESEGG